MSWERYSYLALLRARYEYGGFLTIEEYITLILTPGSTPQQLSGYIRGLKNYLKSPNRQVQEAIISELTCAITDTLKGKALASWPWRIVKKILNIYRTEEAKAFFIEELARQAGQGIRYYLGEETIPGWEEGDTYPIRKPEDEP